MVPRGFLREYSGLVAFVIRVVDLTVPLITFLLAFFIKYGYGQIIPAFYFYPLIAAFIFQAFLFAYFPIGISRRGGSVMEEVNTLTLALIFVFGGLAILSVVTKTSSLYSREWFGWWFLLTWSFLVFSRVIARISLRWMRSHGMNMRNIVVVGRGSVLNMVSQSLRTTPWAGFNILRVFGEAYLKPCEGKEHSMSYADICRFLEEERVDQVWLAMPLSDQYHITALMHELRHNTVDIRYVPDIFGFHLLNHSISEVAGLPVVDLSASPMGGLNRVVKALEDKLIATCVLILASPVLLSIALAVRISSPGPILFKQLRHGWDGKPIKVYKFRTMFVHQPDGGEVRQATRCDARVTPIGSFLRRTSLDELPQFFNVLQGRMSVVGPRPHAIEHNELFKDKIDQYMLRHKVKPGITGWAQVNGHRGETDTVDKMRARVEHDLFYIENWSLWLDLKIILLTSFKGFVHRNAY
ncbi:MAG: undecaprenyl-phosphate glucose phosphotransferase [Gammaproteobacteria bacterium]|nr:undecaprenyl-phosphate glucose phosphotransferase [Gammaproteobacteria bacterium]